MIKGMNTKLKLIRFVVAVTFASLLWAGCASEGYEGRSTTAYSTDADTRPIDLTKRRADTYPERRTGLEDRNRELIQIPDSTINEAAGAERFY